LQLDPHPIGAVWLVGTVDIDGHKAHPRDMKMRDERFPHSRSYHEMSKRKRTLQPFDRETPIGCATWTASWRRGNHVPIPRQSQLSYRQWNRRELSVIARGCFDG
jgi:Ni/Co efflux regulator RcnB